MPTSPDTPRPRLVQLLWRYRVVLGTLIVLAVVIVLAVSGQEAAARWIATIIAGGFALWTAVGMIRDLLRGHVGLDILALIAIVATLVVGEYIAALIIVLMLSGGEALEEFAQRRANRELRALLDRSPQTAHRLIDPEEESAGVVDVPVDEVRVGDELLVRPAEVMPVDAVIVRGAGDFDEASLTGEPLPVARDVGDTVLSGAINGSQAVRVRAVKAAADSQYQQIVALVREAAASRAPVVRLADRFAIPFTVVALILGGVAWAISGDATRFAEVLVLATPCPLLIAAPVAFLGGLSRAAKSGIIIKGGAVIEQLAKIRSAAFDKTGTLTRGRPELRALRPVAMTEDELLGWAASAEQYSTHVLAAGILAAAADRGRALRPAARAEEVATNGVSAVVDGHTVVVGKPGYIASLASGFERTPIADGEAAAYVAVDGVYAGALLLADRARVEARDTVSWLRDHGVANIVILTGDVEPTARAIADQVGITEVHAELLPAQKVRLASELQPRPVMMVGDGVNDAPVLAAADVGIAMGAKGATAAGEAADAVILVDSIAKVTEAIAIGRHTVRVALTAIWIGIALSVGLMLIAMTGVIPAVVGALTQELVDLATILYALRALGGRVDAIGTPHAVRAPTNGTVART